MSDTTLREYANQIISSASVFYRTQRAILHLRRTKLRDKLLKFISSNDVKATYSAAFTILMDGILISSLLYYFIGFNWINIIAFGSGWFWLKKDGIKQLAMLLSSINIIKIGK